MTAHHVVFDEVEIVEEKANCRPRKTVVSVNTFEQKYRRSLSPPPPRGGSRGRRKGRRDDHCKSQKGGRRRPATLSPVRPASNSMSPPLRRPFQPDSLTERLSMSADDIDIGLPQPLPLTVAERCVSDSIVQMSSQGRAAFTSCPSDKPPLQISRKVSLDMSPAHLDPQGMTLPKLGADKPPAHVPRQASLDPSEKQQRPFDAACNRARLLDRPPVHVPRQASQDLTAIASCRGRTPASEGGRQPDIPEVGEDVVV